jgi:methylmalonyl-CoA mutase
MSQPAPTTPSTEPKAERSPLRFVTAASLFDGHDAAINIMRRLIQAQGVEVVHLGHNRSVEDVVRAALQEDADGIALSSYQGGHTEYFKYMVDMLRERGAGHIRVFGGGGGTITPEEIKELQDYGVERIYHPNDGMHMGLVAMIEDVRSARRGRAPAGRQAAQGRLRQRDRDRPHALRDRGGRLEEASWRHLRKEWQLPAARPPVVGMTGTGGAGQVLGHRRAAQPLPGLASRTCTSRSSASTRPRRRTGGALLGDRIRMNSLRSKRVFMRSMATRRQHMATNLVLKDCIAFLKGQGYDLVMVETAGIGQSDSEIVDLVDFPVYVMTSDFGAPSQLEKIDMLDYAELVVLNKFDRRGAEDALRDVRKAWKRNKAAFKMADEDVPVYPTIASQFNDPGITWMFVNLCRLLREKAGAGVVNSSPNINWNPNLDTSLREPRATVLIPGRPHALPGRDRSSRARRHQRPHRRSRPRPPTARRATGSRSRTSATEKPAAQWRCSSPEALTDIDAGPSQLQTLRQRLPGLG